MRRCFNEWQPFDASSDRLLSSLKQWRKAYNLPRTNVDDAKGLVNGGTDLNEANGSEGQRVMTAWESLLWDLWLPKVRSGIKCAFSFRRRTNINRHHSNDWNASSPHAAIHLLESWDSILSPFIRDNVLDQLILPKLKKAVDEWDGRPSRSGKIRSLAGMVFPWLPLLGERAEEVLEGAKRRLRSFLRSWSVKNGLPEELSRWKNDVSVLQLTVDC